MKYTREIAEEVLRDWNYHNSSGSVLYSTDVAFLDSKFPKELPETGLLVHKDKDDFIIYRTGDFTGFGFNRIGKYDIVAKETKEDGAWSFISCPKDWRIATPEDEAKFIKLLKAEAEKRGLGVDAKIKGHVDDFNGMLNRRYFTPNFRLTTAWNKNGKIFHKGIWAEPIKEGIVTPKHDSWVETYCNISSRFFMEKRLKELEDKVEKYSNSVHKETENKKAWWRN